MYSACLVSRWNCPPRIKRLCFARDYMGVSHFRDGGSIEHERIARSWRLAKVCSDGQPQSFGKTTHPEATGGRSDQDPRTCDKISSAAPDRRARTQVCPLQCYYFLEVSATLSCRNMMDKSKYDPAALKHKPLL